MSGRVQNTNKIEKSIEKRLANYPSILTDYYYSMTDNTAATKNAYIRHISDYLDFLRENNYDIENNDTFREMTITEINKYVSYIRYSKNSGKLVENKESIRRARISAVKSFYDYLVDDGIVNKNLWDKVKLPKLVQDINVVAMNKDEITHVKNEIINSDDKWKTRDLLIFTLGCRTGLRVTALCEIDMRDINFSNNTIAVVEKGNSKKEMIIGDDTMKLIKDWISERGDIPGCDALFVSNRKGRISARTVERMIRKYTASLDKHITPHKMRSTCASMLYDATNDVYLVADQLGHRNIANTLRYTGVSEKKKKKAASLLDQL